MGVTVSLIEAPIFSHQQVKIKDRGYSPAEAGEYRAVGYSPANKSAGALMRVNNKSALFTR